MQVSRAAFPAKSKNKLGIIGGVKTEIAVISFTDKILLTICQEGRLAHWVHVPLESSEPAFVDKRLAFDEDGSQLLPKPQLTASTILGATGSERDTFGQLIGTQVGSAIISKDPEESRMLVVGIGMKNAEVSQEEFLSILDMILQCI